MKKLTVVVAVVLALAAAACGTGEPEAQRQTSVTAQPPQTSTSTTTTTVPEPVLGDAIGAWDTTAKTADNSDLATLYPTLLTIDGEEYEFTVEVWRERAAEGESVVELTIAQLGAEGCVPAIHLDLNSPTVDEHASRDGVASFRTTGGESVTQDWSISRLFGVVVLFTPATEERRDVLPSRVLADADTDGVLYASFSFDPGHRFPQRWSFEFPLDVSDTQTVLDLLDC